MYKIPRFWKRFNRMILFNDLMSGRKVVMTTRDDEGNVHHHIERVPHPIPPLGVVDDEPPYDQGRDLNAPPGS